MTKLKRMSMKEYFAKTLPEESLREVKIEYTLAQVAGRAHLIRADDVRADFERLEE